jgi:heptosyltransferase-2/heptosyltransferase-3
LTLPFPGFSRQPNDNWHSPYRLAFQAARHLRRITYSSAIIFRPDHWWGAMVSALASIPHRIGYDLPDTAPFLTHRVQHQHEHAVLQGLRLLESWLGPDIDAQAVLDFPIEDMDRSYIDSYLQEWRIAADKRIFCIHPGSGTWVKQWPEAQWARVADTLAEQLDAVAVFTGVESEFSLVKRITQRMRQRYCIIAGETHIGQLAALYDRAALVLGPDSGPLHLAATVGAPSVSLFGPADPIEFGPWGPPELHIVLSSDIGCRPCRVLDWADDDPAYHPCMQDISVGQVLEAARRVARA